MTLLIGIAIGFVLGLFKTPVFAAVQLGWAAIQAKLAKK